MFDWIKKGLPHPESLGTVKDEIERQVRAGVQGILSRMDLVTRDELDVQLNVLIRTREKLEALELRLAALESSPSTAPTQSHTSPSSTAKPPQYAGQAAFPPLPNLQWCGQF
jgi:BMFP domain-containing protein YqiC